MYSDRAGFARERNYEREKETDKLDGGSHDVHRGSADRDRTSGQGRGWSLPGSGIPDGGTDTGVGEWNS